jgi:hypothetical protein
VNKTTRDKQYRDGEKKSETCDADQRVIDLVRQSDQEKQNVVVVSDGTKVALDEGCR